MGIDQVLVIPTMVIMNLPFAENADGVDAFCQAYNNWCVDWCAEVPDRLFGAALLPLQSPELTAARGHRVAALGCGRPHASDRRTRRRTRTTSRRSMLLAGAESRPVFKAFEETGMVPRDALVPRAMSLGRPSGPARSSLRASSSTWPAPIPDHVLHLRDAGLARTDPPERLPRPLPEAEDRGVRVEQRSGCRTCWPRATGSSSSTHDERTVPATRRPSEAFYEQCAISFESDEEPTLAQWDQFTDIGIWASDCYHHDGADAVERDARALDRVWALLTRCKRS